MYSVVATYLQCRPELGEQHTSETDAMDVSAWTRVVHISADQRLYQLGKDFSFVIHCLCFALCGIVVKKIKYTALKKLDSPLFSGHEGLMP